MLLFRLSRFGEESFPRQLAVRQQNGIDQVKCFHRSGVQHILHQLNRGGTNKYDEDPRKDEQY